VFAGFFNLIKRRSTKACKRIASLIATTIKFMSAMPLELNYKATAFYSHNALMNSTGLRCKRKVNKDSF